ncbi:hypothetical protein KY284_023599 [Solanum tuberosum]|nr:hypothetical protein KY284_023599 [Solanum tuberosum]
MTMVYELLKRRFIFYNNEKKDEVLINYCGMPLCFSKKEFAIVTGLKCHSPSESIHVFTAKKQPRRRKKGGKAQTSKEQSTEEQDLVSLVGPSFKNPKLVALLNDKDTSRNHKESLCLLWFVHNVLLSKDVNNNIPLNYVKFSKDIEAFNNYLWCHDSYEFTVKYLLDPLSPKTNNLFGCPWAFMACTFEAIPHLKHQITAKEEISSPRILRWLTAKNVKNSPDLFNPPDDAMPPYVAIYHPYVATCDTSVTTCDPNVAIDDSYVATYHPSIAICDPNVDIDDSYIATDDPFVATRDINIATDAHMLQHYSNI